MAAVHHHEQRGRAEARAGPAVRADPLVRQLLHAGRRTGLPQLRYPAVRVPRGRIHSVSFIFLPPYLLRSLALAHP